MTISRHDSNDPHRSVPDDSLESSDRPIILTGPVANFHADQHLVLGFPESIRRGNSPVPVTPIGVSTRRASPIARVSLDLFFSRRKLTCFRRSHNGGQGAIREVRTLVGCR
jgi:hypothetical protein